MGNFKNLWLLPVKVQGTAVPRLTPPVGVEHRAIGYRRGRMGGTELSYVLIMLPNLADPSFEPTDEQLQELSKRAFAHLADARREVDARLREEIARLSEQVLRRLHEKQHVKP